MVLTLIWNYFYTIILYSLQKSAGVTAHMFRAVARAMGLAAHSPSGRLTGGAAPSTCGVCPSPAPCRSPSFGLMTWISHLGVNEGVHDASRTETKPSCCLWCVGVYGHRLARRKRWFSFLSVMLHGHSCCWWRSRKRLCFPGALLGCCRPLNRKHSLQSVVYLPISWSFSEPWTLLPPVHHRVATLALK